ncbi:MAG TPA: radical SAM protein [Phycisphaerae bacterium]|mgnify:CR=1 FL=1|nr:radical SAM protein [Phycisphaerae bacterium]HRW54336.1 radical SAM protein [Phycisphaerae bacterium]
MKLGFIAMSGVRAENAELVAAGLTMPGVVERSKVVASLPSLSLLTLAGMTPDEFDVSYHEVADLAAAGDLSMDFDVVAISSLTAQIDEAYAIADRYRAAGVRVVMGGLHVSALPDEALAHCDAIVIGEGEMSWPRLLEDLRSGRLARVYRPADGAYFQLADAPMPRFDLLEPARYNRVTIQTSRGCPHRCDFCASSILLTPFYRVKPVERVIAEARRVKELFERPFFEFADDNSFAAREHYKELLRALKKEHVKWFTEADISIANDFELLELMRESGCRQVLIGLESPAASALDGVELKRNWKLRQAPDYEGAIRRIQSRGITVNGCFILGMDAQTPAVFDEVYDFVERSGLYETQVTVMTPFPGTPLYERLRSEGRLLEERAWRKCTLFDVNFRPLRMSVSELESGFLNLVRRLYDPEVVDARRRRFIEMCHSDEDWSEALRRDAV